MSLLSCKKDNNNPSADNTTIQSIGFEYAENGNSNYTKADSAIAYAQHKTIIVYQGSKVVLEFVLTNHNTGNHSLSPKYAMTYVKDGKHWEATDGQLNISKNDGQTLSGTFEATAGSGVPGVQKVNGKFSEIPLR